MSDWESTIQGIMNGNTTGSVIDRNQMQIGAARAGNTNLLYGNPSGAHLKVNNLAQAFEVYNANNKKIVSLGTTGLVQFTTAGVKTTVLDASGLSIYDSTGTAQLVASAGKMTVGGTNLTIDGVNAREVVNDGTNDRVLMGKQVGGF